ncbi:antirestriction protein ArdA [Anabaena cylindrica FACHB-243]|nr:antirestriction protein ArdA [Anabaena cylindrica FACHB-243]MBY5284497.1 antirestriction protein ArdA [Anabaena sp. CCAP 1446/1C]MBY5306755.1 antirestriction protein ArdA [Anabaena sp. CCAP 1446/1C]
MELTLLSESDAIAIEEQLNDVYRNGKTLIIEKLDRAALSLAASLAGVDFPYFNNCVSSSLKCNLPYPVNQRECTYQDTPKIYVACLSAYNSGKLHGLYIDATQDTEDILDDINWMLSWSPVRNYEPCEEWAIHDHENFGDFSIGEYESLEYISQLAKALDSAADKDAMSAWLNYAKGLTSDPNIEELAEEFGSYYCGRWDSEKDFALKSEDIESMFNWSEFEKNFKFWSFHIDWDSVARELFMEGYDSVKADRGVYVFREYHG